MNVLLLFYMSGSQHLMWLSSVTSALSSTVDGRDNWCFNLQSNFPSKGINFIFQVK
jgi:hypothetical protein